MSNWIACVIFESLYFLILYLIAFFANKDYREDDDIFWIAKSQWKAILVMWIPTIFAWIER